MKRFAYHAPASLKEAVGLLVDLGPGARPLAGGTDLLVQMKQGAIQPDHLVDLQGVPDLVGVVLQGDGTVRIGALTTLKELASSPVIGSHLPILAEAALTMGCPEIRGMATVGGNLCSAVPSADLAPPLLALGARAVVAGPEGTRTLGLDTFFRGPRQTCLGVGEILMAIEVPDQGRSWTGAYLKYGRRNGMDLAIVGVAAVVCWDGHGGSCPATVRLALGAVAPTPMRSLEAEAAAMRCGIADEDARAQCGKAAARECRPISDIRASEEYRRLLVRVLTARALRLCVERRGGQ